MKPPESSSNMPDVPILVLIQGLKDGSVHPSTLAKEQRLACVEALYVEGYSLSQIAQVVERSEKTIKRDLAEIHTKNALTPSLELARQMIGRIQLRSEAHQARLMRLARGSEGSVSERAQAEYMAWQVEKDTAVLMQSLGYLPERPQQVVGDVVHRFGGAEEEFSLTQIEATLQEIERVARDTDRFTPELATQLQDLRQQLNCAKLNQAAQRLLGDYQNPPQTQETPNAQPQ